MKEDAMHDWVEMIINKSWPVIWVEDEYIQLVIKHLSSANLFTKTVQSFFCLGGDGDGKHSEQINGKVGATVHDVWSPDVIHYLGVFEFYET